MGPDVGLWRPFVVKKKKKRLLDFSSKDQEIEVNRDPIGSQRRLSFLRMVAKATDPLVGPTEKTCMTLT